MHSMHLVMQLPFSAIQHSVRNSRVFLHVALDAQAPSHGASHAVWPHLRCYDSHSIGELLGASVSRSDWLMLVCYTETPRFRNLDSLALSSVATERHVIDGWSCVGVAPAHGCVHVLRYWRPEVRQYSTIGIRNGLILH